MTERAAVRLLTSVLMVVAITGAFAAWGARSAHAAGNPGFSISPADEDRMFMVAGCVPFKFKLRFMASVWVPCNDPNSELAVDKIVESPLVSCPDLLPDGVVRGLFIDEVNNRSWQSFRFSCASLQRDGTVTPSTLKSPNLFNFSGAPTHYQTIVADAASLSFGIFEVYNALQLRESLLSIGLEHAEAGVIFDAGQKTEHPSHFGVTDQVPKAYPVLIASQSWFCPSGTVFTGASVGHIPHDNGKWTRPVFVTMECRRLLVANPAAVKVPPPPTPLALGAACATDGQCLSGKCGTVAGSLACVCGKDLDCGAGRFCNMGVDLQANACQSVKADGETCTLVDGARTCRSGHCGSGRCFTPRSVAMGGTCYLDDACQAGKCSSIDGTRGSCVCQEDSSCSTGFWCDRGADLTRNVCRRKLDRGEVCGITGELGVGHRCKSGECKLAGISTSLTCE